MFSTHRRVSSGLAEQARRCREVEAAEERKRKAERDAKLRRAGEDKGRAEEERAKRPMFNSWVERWSAGGV